MLLSMTGHGEATAQNDRLSVTVEVKSVNNRHLKVSVRCPDSFLALETNIEKVVRQVVTRGTLNIAVRVRHLTDAATHAIDAKVLAHYWRQLTQAAEELATSVPQDLGPLLPLPGIVDEGDGKSVEASDWPLIENVLAEALQNLQEFRHTEGREMADELVSLSGVIEENASKIAARAPGVVADYRERLKQRVNDALKENGIDLADTDIIREVSLFADRCDITEELTRLRSHLKQYRSLVEADSSNGRKLEFIGQELFREVNTIGSKANDVEISHMVVEMKAAIEKMREIIQNIE
ncbi:MAG: YicC family protein [Planctomycetaceae bacterium]|nr:YicC family protein [Planctomycetaceae bacterium]